MTNLHFLAFMALGLASALGQSMASQTIGNLSIRGQAGPTTPFISGFVLQGNASTPLLIRGAGPALRAYGVTAALSRPVLTVYDSRGEKVAENSGWRTRPQDEWTAIRRLGAGFSFDETGDDCGLVLSLAPGLYTVQLSGLDGTSGIGLIELYQGNGLGTVPQSSPHLINVSSRCTVGAGESVAIAGLTLPMGRKVLIRAIGPGLAAFGVNGVLANPRLEVVRPATSTVLIGGVSSSPAVVVLTNDDWNDQQPLTMSFDTATNTPRPVAGVSWRGSAEEIRAATASAGAFPIAEGSREAVVLVTVDHSPMTVHVSGAEGGTGVALVEAYDVGPADSAGSGPN